MNIDEEFSHIISSEFKKIEDIRQTIKEHYDEFGQFRKFKNECFPQDDHAKIFHIAGTNGKGSVCAMLDSVYRAAGYRVGLYISPALLDIRERIQLDRQYISKEDFCRIYHVIDDRAKAVGMKLTIFGLFTMVALQYFQEMKADVIILETGVGGRADGTNILPRATACIITSIGFDHENVLGDTIAKIAHEKAGIIKEGSRVFIGALPKEAEEVIANTCTEKQVPLYRASRKARTNLVGDYQKINASVVYTVANTLRDVLPISDLEIRYGLMHTFWPGRNHKVLLENGNAVIFDGGHNSEAADIQKNYVRRTFGRKRSCLIFSSTKSRHTEHFLATYYPYFSEILLCNVSNPHKRQDDSVFKDLEKKYKKKCRFLSIKEVVKILGNPTDKKFFVTGSLYLVGEIAHDLIHAGQMKSECFERPNTAYFRPEL